MSTHKHHDHADDGHAHGHVHGGEHDRHHEQDHGHTHGHGPGHGASCGGSVCGTETKALTATAAGGLLLRIPAMDCPTEEGQIRRALERFPDVRGLRFDLPARALSIDAPHSAWEPVISAINGLGFKTETLSAPPPAEDTAKA